MLLIHEHEVVKAIPAEQVSKRIVELIARSVLVGRIKDQDAEQMVDFPVPRVMEEIVAPKQNIGEAIVDVPVP